MKLPRCLTNGVHTPGSDWEAECPVLRARRRQEAPERNARVRTTPDPTVALSAGQDGTLGAVVPATEEM